MKLKTIPNFAHQKISTLTSFIYPSVFIHKNNLYEQDRSLLMLCNLIILTHSYVMGILRCRKVSALLASWLHSNFCVWRNHTLIFHSLRLSCRSLLLQTSLHSTLLSIHFCKHYDYLLRE